MSSPGSLRARWRGGLAWIIAATACTAVGTRPFFGPLPGTPVDTLGANPGTVIGALAAKLAGLGLSVRRVSQTEGYLETAWFDPVTRRSVGQEHRHTQRVFRIRAFADSLPPSRVELSLETVYRRLADPSAPGREDEILVPPGHPGDSLAQHLLGELREQFRR